MANIDTFLQIKKCLRKSKNNFFLRALPLEYLHREYSLNCTKFKTIKSYISTFAKFQHMKSHIFCIFCQNNIVIDFSDHRIIVYGLDWYSITITSSLPKIIFIGLFHNQRKYLPPPEILRISISLKCCKGENVTSWSQNVVTILSFLSNFQFWEIYNKKDRNVPELIELIKWYYNKNIVRALFDFNLNQIQIKQTNNRHDLLLSNILWGKIVQYIIV